MLILEKSYLEIIDTFKSNSPHIYLSTSNISSFRKRLLTNLPLINSFFTYYDEFYYELDDPSLFSVVKKIELFINQHGDFNHSFYEKMPKYFFAKT